MVGPRPLAFIALLAASHAVAGPTALCNPTPWQTKIDLWPVDEAVAYRIQMAVASPASDPQFYAVLGNATRADLSYVSSQQMLELSYPVVEDVGEIVKRMNANYLVLGGVPDIFSVAGGGGCFGVPTAATALPVTEYYNAGLDHYFLSSSAAENANIDQGGAGPGWARTGEAWTAYRPDECAVPRTTKWVYRFYGTPGLGPNSHFFTPGPQECGLLRNGTGWTYEGPAFGAEMPTEGGMCPSGAPRPVYRAYNRRAPQNDSNHRYTINFAIYQQMIARGWAGEGISFCLASETCGNPPCVPEPPPPSTPAPPSNVPR